jgi:hypothetical protein
MSITRTVRRVGKGVAAAPAGRARSQTRAVPTRSGPPVAASPPLQTVKAFRIVAQQIASEDDHVMPKRKVETRQ